MTCEVGWGSIVPKASNISSLQSFVWPFSVLVCSFARPFGFSLRSSSFRLSTTKIFVLLYAWGFYFGFLVSRGLGFRADFVAYTCS